MRKVSIGLSLLDVSSTRHWMSGWLAKTAKWEISSKSNCRWLGVDMTYQQASTSNLLSGCNFGSSREAICGNMVMWQRWIDCWIYLIKLVVNWLYCEVNTTQAQHIQVLQDTSYHPNVWFKRHASSGNGYSWSEEDNCVAIRSTS